MQSWMNATGDIRAQPCHEFAEVSIGTLQVAPGIIGLMLVMQRA